MKLDLVEINKLSPPELWDLGTVSAVISMLLDVVKSRLCGYGASLFYVRMIAWHSQSLRHKIRENLNIRIKAWVMQCPVRITWVRHIIGEAAIRKWQKNRLADYALTKYFGDWKRKWPNGFAHKTAHPKQRLSPQYKLTERPYNWKPFALIKIENVERILFGRPSNNPDITDIEITLEPRAWAQIRKPRALKPIEFTPNELVPEAATGKPQDGENLIEKTQNTDGKRLPTPPDKIPEDTILVIEEQKPP